MTRKYQGPLQPGKKSAAVPGKRKNGSKIPSRGRVSRKRTSMTTAISKAISNNSENKFRGSEIECATPVEIPSGADQPISYHFFNSGPTLAVALPEFKMLNMFEFKQGTGNSERVGNSMYIKNGYVNMNIQTLPMTEIGTISGDQPLIEFRLMVVKANRKYNPLGDFYSPGKTLYLTPGNNTFGYEDSQNTHNFKLQPINKRKWLVYRDQRFTLSYPVVDQRIVGTPGYQVNNSYQKYSTSKTCKIKLPVMKKTHFNNTTNNPDNLDTQWLIILQAMHPSFCTMNSRRPENYVVNINSTTVAQDN